MAIIRRPFRGHPVAAPLKPADKQGGELGYDLVPRPSGRGPIEAGRTARGGRLCRTFRGHPVAAPLKLMPRKKEPVKAATFRGHPVAAPLKPGNQGNNQVKHRRSAAIRSRPH